MARRQPTPRAPPATRQTRASKAATPAVVEESSELSELSDAASEFVRTGAKTDTDTDGESVTETADESGTDNAATVPKRPQRTKKGPATKYPSTITQPRPPKGQSRKKKTSKPKATEATAEVNNDQHDWSDDYQLGAKPADSNVGPQSRKGPPAAPNQSTPRSKTTIDQSQDPPNRHAENGGKPAAGKGKSVTVHDVIEIGSDAEENSPLHQVTPKPRKLVQLTTHGIEEIPRSTCL